LTENKIIDSQLRIKAPKPQATTPKSTSYPKTDTIGLYRKQVIERLQTNDSTYSERFNLGNRIKYIHIYVGKNKPITTVIEHYTRQSFYPLYQIRKLLKENTIALEREGYSLARLKLKISSLKGNICQLEFESEKQRRLNAIIKQTDDQQKHFPTGHLTQISRKYKTKLSTKK
jgi:hypothetical protein